MTKAFSRPRRRGSGTWIKYQVKSQRKTPCYPSSRKPRSATPKKQLGERYATNAYGHAVRDACIKANVPRWTPNQLRHNAATRLRKKFGGEVAQVLLGHSSINVTEIYAERNVEAAVRAISDAG